MKFSTTLILSLICGVTSHFKVYFNPSNNRGRYYNSDGHHLSGERSIPETSVRVYAGRTQLTNYSRVFRVEYPVNGNFITNAHERTIYPRSRGYGMTFSLPTVNESGYEEETANLRRRDSGTTFSLLPVEEFDHKNGIVYFQFISTQYSLFCKPTANEQTVTDEQAPMKIPKRLLETITFCAVEGNEKFVFNGAELFKNQRDEAGQFLYTIFVLNDQITAYRVPLMEHGEIDIPATFIAVRTPHEKTQWKRLNNADEIKEYRKKQKNALHSNSGSMKHFNDASVTNNGYNGMNYNGPIGRSNENSFYGGSNDSTQDFSIRQSTSNYRDDGARDYTEYSHFRKQPNKIQLDLSRPTRHGGDDYDVVADA